ncbi:hypothetical protein [Vibrio fluvialis]|uniref:hypothetical protein n=1 Tax=Vibrio fluvialis TaxID=676 RepID=UPI0023A9E34A|nr:hypothetical protein [Vibrio fluvialis]MDE5179036.1 hypothetical protein [Vibrio fluvialis]
MSSETTTQNPVKPTLATSKKFCLVYIGVTTASIFNGLFVVVLFSLGSLYYASKLSKREEKEPVHEMMRTHLRQSGMNGIKFAMVALLISLLLMISTQSIYLSPYTNYFSPFLLIFILSFISVQLFNLFRLWKGKLPYPNVGILITWPFRLTRHLIAHIFQGLKR